MKRWIPALLFALVCVPPLAAQQMSVEEFACVKGHKVQKDKTHALLDLATDESGFTVLAEGNQPVEVQQKEGFIRLLLPHKTGRLTIRHPNYGQLSWVVPDGKTLRKKCYYSAVLFTIDPTKETKAKRQWVIFQLDPENLILQIDSTTHLVRQKDISYFLPLGEHHYRAEAPFFDPQEGSFTLTDSLGALVSVKLQPFYSYLSVDSEWKGGELYLDGTPFLQESAGGYRIQDGRHRVTMFWNEQCYLDTLVYVGRSEKKVLRLESKDLKVKTLSKEELSRGVLPSAPLEAHVVLTCQDPGVEILIDREYVGKGQWEGLLPLGFHLLTARKDGVEGASQRVMLEDPAPQEFVLMAPGTGYGLASIHSNVEGARILIDGEDGGVTPNLVKLDASRSHEITLVKPGYKPQTTQVRPKGNAQVDVYVRLKKK